MKNNSNDLSHFIHLSEWDDSEMMEVLSKALALKKENYRNPVAREKVLGLIFLNPSLRTKISFETAAAHLGAASTLIQPGQGTWTFETETGAIMDGDRTEHLKEAIQVISRYVDTIGVRAFAGLENLDEDIEDQLMQDIVQYATVPVINMESAREHPCQALADGMTILEQFDQKPQGKKFVLSWAPHPKPLPMAVPNSALEIASRLGMEVVLACPPEMTLDKRILDGIEHNANHHGTRFSIEHEQERAFQDADVIYGKSWAGPIVYTDPDEEHDLRTREYSNWTIDQSLMSVTNNASFMHCLPVRRNVVVTDSVLDSPRAIHIDEAENRLHVQKAVLMKLWGLL
ncbi:N-acetylornithine carbamoyltransferase [Balneolaceae bacterium ANBcel3]|nr:N-acetylornithine carbamoyltransferase [Balneolaceae bacterium ANBcel3]